MTNLRHHATVLVFNRRKHCNAAIRILTSHQVRGGGRSGHGSDPRRRGATAKRREPISGKTQTRIHQQSDKAIAFRQTATHSSLLNRELNFKLKGIAFLFSQSL